MVDTSSTEIEGLTGGFTREYVTDVPFVLLGLVAACAAVAVFRRTSPNRRA